MLYIVTGREVSERNSNPKRPFKALDKNQYGRYETFMEADTMAGQLAAQYEGMEFIVFQAIETVRAAPAPILRERFE